jgi:hypothetical protein
LKFTLEQSEAVRALKGTAGFTALRSLVANEATAAVESLIGGDPAHVQFLQGYAKALINLNKLIEGTLES